MRVKFGSSDDKPITMETENDFDFNSEEMKWVDRMGRLNLDFNDLEEITDKWGFFRQIYMESLPYIMERAKVDIVTPINPYPVDWVRHLSPIEFSAWCSIRSHYMALYPQFPVFNSFIDFANPYLRIGVEMDGKEFHDPIKDKTRDEKMWKYGWRIFRIPGKECYVKFKHRDEIEEDFNENHQDQEQRFSELEQWMTETSDGFFFSLKMVYFKKAVDHELYDTAIYALHHHRGADFPLLDGEKEYLKDQFKK